MKKVNTFGIQFVIRKHRIKEGTVPIYAVFSCYTGLAYIDVMRLTSNNIRKGIDGMN
jgi:hypothetical protein